MVVAMGWGGMGWREGGEGGDVGGESSTVAT